MSMTPIKGIIYRLLTSPLILYRKRYTPPFIHVGYPPKEWISDFDEASQTIYKLLDSKAPCMISRYGSNEFLCMEYFMKGHHPFWFLRSIFPFWADKELIKAMTQNAGFFSPDGYNAFVKLADLFYDCGKQIDLLACWFRNQEIIEKEMNYRLCWILSIEPFWSKNPWSRWLKDKNVLVVHPFAETIKSQYEKRELLFENPDVLPEFKSLTVIKAVQSIGGESNGFRDWFEALHSMEQQIDQVDYDVALIGCGAYGMPLAAHCKSMGKKAVHLGGALQLLFGIKGNRWLNNYGDGKSIIPDYPKLLSNPNWVYPSDADRPKNADKVEGACYWK